MEENLEFISPLTYQNAELVIPSRALSYGVFKVAFTTRIWDDSISDPNWTHKIPFFSDDFTYLKIIKSELIGMIVKGGISMLSRGRGQSITLEPYLYAEDPDYPEDQVFICEN